MQEFADFLSSPIIADYRILLEEVVTSQETEDTFPYRSMVGSLIYAMNGTRFDIAVAVSVVSRFLENPKKIHCDMVRRIFYYLRGNLELCIIYPIGGALTLEGWCDASYANDLESRSKAGFCFKLGLCIISWHAK